VNLLKDAGVIAGAVKVKEDWGSSHWIKSKVNTIDGIAVAIVIVLLVLLFVNKW
jgi:hypothetical protein